jgi:hypothetical protein
MQINDSMISNRQNYINIWTAISSYNDLRHFAGQYIEKRTDEFGTTYHHDRIFEKDFESEEECLENYCIRSKIIKMATETCELFCKAILIDNGKNWGDAKGLGHNLLDCYNSLSDDDKNLIECVPLDYMMSFTVFFPILLSPPAGCENNYKEEYPDEYPIPLTDYLNSFATGRILPNIKARYPGQSLVDYNERFILAFTKILHSYVFTKKVMKTGLDDLPLKTLMKMEASGIDEELPEAKSCSD